MVDTEEKTENKKSDSKNSKTKNNNNIKNSNNGKTTVKSAENKIDMEKPKNDNTEKGKKQDVKEVVADEIEEPKEEKKEVIAKEHSKLIKFEEIKNIFKKKKKIPKEDKKNIRKPVIYNFLVMIIVVLYFVFLILGFNNIEKSVYQTDLKVFAICALFLAIILLERAYSKENKKVAVYGVETLIIAIVTLGLIYVNLMLSSQYINILLIILGIVVVYYFIKSIVIRARGKKKYFLDNMKEIINTEE